MNIRLAQNSIRVRLDQEEAGFIATGGTAGFSLPLPMRTPVHVLVSLQTMHEMDRLEWNQHSIHVRINPRTLEKMAKEDVGIQLGGSGETSVSLMLEIDRHS